MQHCAPSGESLHYMRTARALRTTFRLQPPEEPPGTPHPNGLKIEHPLPPYPWGCKVAEGCKKCNLRWKIFFSFFRLKNVASMLKGFYSTETLVCWNSLYLNIVYRHNITQSCQTSDINIARKMSDMPHTLHLLFRIPV